MLNTTADISNSLWKSLYKMADRKVARQCMVPQHTAMPLFASQGTSGYIPLQLLKKLCYGRDEDKEYKGTVVKQNQKESGKGS